MKKYLLILSIVLSFNSNALAVSRKLDKQVIKETYTHSYGVTVSKSEWNRRGKDGVITRIFKDGTVLTENFYKGLYHGEVFCTYPHSSVIAIKKEYSHGTLVSILQNFRNGLPQKEELFLNDGSIKLSLWHEGDANPWLVETKKDSLLMEGVYHSPKNSNEKTKISNGSGIKSLFSADGTLLSEEIYDNGLLVTTIKFYTNKDPAVIISYLNNQPHGIRQTFDLGGIPNTLEEWRYGQQDGMTIVFKNGQKVSEIPYIKGLKDGTEIRYNEGLEVVEEISWKRNILHGVRKINTDDISKVEWYYQGKLVSKHKFDRLNIQS